MKNFFLLEGAYITIGFFILAITVFVSTRPFMKKTTLKKALIWVSLFLITIISLHYYITISRIKSVKQAFLSGKTIVCESRENRKMAQSIEISKGYGWKLQNDMFYNDNYKRGFHSARCIIKTKIILKNK